MENRRCGRGKVVQRQVLYLGEINDTQHESWCRTIEVFDDKRERTLPLALFPADRQLPNFAAGFGVQVRLKEMELHRPRQWGACWLACDLYEQLGLDEFWGECLPDSREGTCWQHILETLVCYRLIDPGSEWGAALRSSAPTLAGSFRCPIRSAALRFNQHLFRERSGF